MLAFWKNDGKGIVVGFDGNDEELIKKLRKSKSKKLFKFRKLAKFKKPSKSVNLPNFSAKEAKLSFFTFGTRKVFNCL